ncbi:MAG TPA: hypothetical protein PLF81_12010, partial [Candidatus Anammoximicrobium sp.]|nr:hypothetical protein [Candidatus Anammoximicrobium sp.]
TGMGTLWSPMIDLSTVAPTDVGALLSFNYFLETDGAASGDLAQVQVYDYQTGTFTTVAANDTGELADPSTGFRRATTDLSPFLGHQIQLQFTYTADAVGNAVEGWYVDDVQVYVASNLDLHLEVPQLRGQTFWLRVQDDPNAPCNTAVYDLHVISHDKFDAFGASNDLEVSHGVAVFDNASYVDTSDGYWAESDTVQASLASFGHPVSTFTGTSAVDINAALAGNTVLLIPEAENGNLLSAFDAAARAAISGFVASGGGMVIHYADDAFLNAVFGFSVSTTSEYYTTYLDAVAAAGTPFESGPGSLDPFSATEALSISSLPAGSRAIYTDGGNEATVVLMPFGAGQIVYLGWDWYNAAPLGTEDGGWLRVLDSAVGQFTVATGGTDLGEVIYHLETELSAGAGDHDWFTFTEPVGDHPAKTIVMPLVDRDHDGILDPEETLSLELWTGSWGPTQLLAIGHIDPNDPFTVRIDGVPSELGQQFWIHVAGIFDFETGTESQNEYDLEIIDLDRFDVQHSGLYVVAQSGSLGNIFEIDPDDGSVLATLPVPETTTGGPVGLAFDGRALYFVNGWGSGTVFTLDPLTGDVINAWGSPIGTSLDALAADVTTGSLYGLDWSTDTIYRIDIADPVLGTGAVFDSAVSPEDLVGGIDFHISRGTLYATVGYASLVELQYTPGAPGTATISVVNGPIPAPTSGLYGVGVLGTQSGPGRLFLADSGTATVYELDPTTLLPTGVSNPSPGFAPSAAAGGPLASIQASNDTAETATDLGKNVYSFEDNLKLPLGDDDWYKITAWKPDSTIDVRVTIEDNNQNGYIDTTEMLDLELWTDTDGDMVPDTKVADGKLQGLDLVIAHEPAQPDQMFWVHVKGHVTHGPFDQTVLVVERPGPAAPGGQVVRYDQNGNVVQAIQADALYILDNDAGAGRILKMDPNNGNWLVSVTAAQIGAVTGFGSAWFTNENDIVFDAAGSAFFTESWSGSVLEFAADGTITVLADAAALDAATPVAFQDGWANPLGITLGQDGNLYVIEGQSDSVLQIVPATGVVTLQVAAQTLVDQLAPIELVNLNDIEADCHGTLYVNNNDQDDNSVPYPDAIIAISEARNAPGDPVTLSVLAYDDSHGITPPAADDNWLGEPDNFIAVHPSGDVIVADMSWSQLLRVDASTGAVSVYVTTTQLNMVSGGSVYLQGGFKFDRGGFLYVTDADTDAILKFAPDISSGVVLRDIPGASLEAGIAFGPALDSIHHGDLDMKLSHGVLSDIEVGPGGYAYVAQDLSYDGPGGAGQLVEIDQDGNVVGAVGLPDDAPGGFYVYGFDVAPDGTFWVAQPNSGNIVHVDTLYGLHAVLATYAVGGTPLDAAFNPDDGWVYYTDDASGEVRRLDPSSTPATPTTAPVVTGLSDPRMLNFVAPAIGDGDAGNDMFWVAEETSPGAIRLFTAAGLEVNPPSPIATLNGPVDPEQLGANVWTTIFADQAVQVFDAGDGTQASFSPIPRGVPGFDCPYEGWPVGIAIATQTITGVKEYSLSISNMDRLEHNDFFPGYPTTSSIQGVPNQVDSGVPTAGSFPVNVSTDPATYQYSADIAVNPANPDNLVIVATSYDAFLSRDYVDLYRSADGGHTWFATRIDSTVDGFADTALRYAPKVEFDRAGNAYVAYIVQAADFTSTSIVLARFTNDGATFESSAVLATENTAVAYLYNPQVAIGPDFNIASQDDVYVSWTRSSTTSYFSEILLNGSAASNGGLLPLSFAAGTLQTVSDVTATGSDWSSPAVGPAGEVYVTWVDYNTGTTMFDVDPDGMANPAPFFADTTVPGSGSNPSIDVDRSGGPHHGRVYIASGDSVTFSDDANNPLGPTWSAPVSAGIGYLTALDVDQVNGDVNVVGWTVTARSRDGGATWGNAFTLSAGGGYTSVAGHGGAAFFAWTDSVPPPWTDMDVFFNAIHPPTDLGLVGAPPAVLDELSIPKYDEDWFQFVTGENSYGVIHVTLDLADRNFNGVLDADEMLMVELYNDNNGVDEGDFYFVPPVNISYNPVPNADGEFEMVATFPALHTGSANELYLLRVFGGYGGEFGELAYNNYDLHLQVNTTAVVFGDQDKPCQNDVIQIRRNDSDPSIVDVFINNPTFNTTLGERHFRQIGLTGLESLNIFGLGGDDVLIVDYSNGPITTPGMTEPFISFNGDGDGSIIFQSAVGLDVNNDGIVDGFDVNGDGDPDYFGDPDAFVGALPCEGFDSIQVINGTARAEEILAGPREGQGRITETALVDSLDSVDGIANQRITYINLEPVFTNIAAPLTIIAPPSANAINYVEGSHSGDAAAPYNGNTTGVVTIDEFEIFGFEFTNKPSLTINAGAGSDEINLNNPTTPDGLTQITINGGDPTGSDTLIVNGTPAQNLIQYTPSGSDSGSIVNAGPVPIAINQIEHLKLNGQGGNDTLTVIGAAGVSDVFTHTPGSTADSGSMAVNSRLPVSYQNLGAAGTVVAQGASTILSAENDVLVVKGTGGNDWFEAEQVDSVNYINEVRLTEDSIVHLPVQFSGMRELTIAGLEGDDHIRMVPNMWLPPVANPNPPPAQLTAMVRLTVEGGGPGDSDVVLMDHSDIRLPAGDYSVSYRPGVADDAGTVAESGNAFLDFFGVEHLQLLGNGLSDTLELNDDLGDNTWQIAPGPAIVLAATRSAIDGRTPVDFENFARVKFANNAGVDRFEVSPKRLTGGVYYEVVGVDTNVPNARFVDTLVILGSGESDGDDPANDPMVVTDLAVTLGQTINYSQLGSLEIHGLNGDDTLQVDSSAGPVTTPLVFDGGSGSDTLQVRDAPDPNPFHEVIYAPGPAVTEGRLLYKDVNNATLMKIDFINLEPVQDNVPAAILTVYGTGADNAIDYVQGPNSGNAASLFNGLATGLVQVDAFESIEFARKGTLAINGIGGSDVVNLNNSTSTPANLTAITVNGGDPTGSDTVIVNGTAGNNNIAVDQLTNDGARITGAQPVPVTVDTTEHLTIQGLGGTDNLTYTTPAGQTLVLFTPGATADAATIEAEQGGGAL